MTMNNKKTKKQDLTVIRAPNPTLMSFINGVNDFTQLVANKLSTLADNLPIYINNYVQHVKLLKSNYLYFAENGWFPSFQLSDYDRASYSKIIEDNDIEALKTFIGQHANKIIDDVIQKNPKRNIFLSAAIDAHNNSKYIFSVPIFLAHADGILQEHLNISPFMKAGEKGFKKNKIFTEKNNLELRQLILPMLHIHDSSDGYKVLNRNDILHGAVSSLDYPNEENSLKAISFISYINFLTYMAIEKE